MLQIVKDFTVSATEEVLAFKTQRIRLDTMISGPAVNTKSILRNLSTSKLISTKVETISVRS
jgi:hypothetical protein